MRRAPRADWRAGWGRDGGRSRSFSQEDEFRSEPQVREKIRGEASLSIDAVGIGGEAVDRNKAAQRLQVVVFQREPSQARSSCGSTVMAKGREIRSKRTRCPR